MDFFFYFDKKLKKNKRGKTEKKRHRGYDDPLNK
jgi:hypothetical protein